MIKVHKMKKICIKCGKIFVRESNPSGIGKGGTRHAEKLCVSCWNKSRVSGNNNPLTKTINQKGDRKINLYKVDFNGWRNYQEQIELRNKEIIRLNELVVELSSENYKIKEVLKLKNAIPIRIK